MKHFVYAQSDKYPIALLVKHTSFDQNQIEKAYIKPLEKEGVSRDDIIIVSLPYNDAGKAPVKYIKRQLESILGSLISIGCDYLYCADAAYFKVLTKSGKAEPNLGYDLECSLENYEDMHVTLGINHRALTYNPINEGKLNLSIKTLAQMVNKTYKPLGEDIIQNAYYPDTLEKIEEALDKLHTFPFLAVDIEGFSLDFDKAAIGTITFCWSDREGIAFACDYEELAEPEHLGAKNYLYGKCVINHAIRKLLKRFFDSYKGRMRFHGSTYDVGAMVYALYMRDLYDNAGLIKGIETFMSKFDDTLAITYLATNSTGGNELGLKKVAQEFAGNWAEEEIKDIRKIPLKDLLQYNLVDGLATNWAYDKNLPIMEKDCQAELYRDMFLPSLRLIVQLELTGLPMLEENIAKAESKLAAIRDDNLSILNSSAVIRKLTQRLRIEAMNKRNSELKTKQLKLEDFAHIVFNPDSRPQLQKLLYEEMGLPVIDKTDTKLPATGAKTLKKLLNHAYKPEYLAVIEALINLSKVSKILSAFIPNFKAGLDKKDGRIWLHGCFNLGGTVSGRLSSSNPNMQQIPSGSTYGKLIKSCFSAPDGWLFCGADFNSLEDYISALTTQDPNKLKVYQEGYDGHCLRAFSYFGDKMPDIVDTVESINSIEDLYPKIRQDSKGPTFALTYGGTYRTLMNDLGFTKAQAEAIEKNYHKLYEVADNWVQDKLDAASHNGHVTLAFGLRLRTPLIGKSIRNHRTTPYETEAEGRTAGNALGQSYGLLNNRAAIEFMERVWKSPYRNKIKPGALIHDAIYLIIKNEIDVVEWVNTNLIECMQWQELPELEHDTVKLGAELSIFYPTWADEIKIPNKSSRHDIVKIVRQAA